MALYLITFELEDTRDEEYEKLYAWVHKNSGYRYYPYKDGTWRRLPAGTILIELNTTSADRACDTFTALINMVGHNLTHVVVIEAGNAKTHSTIAIDEADVPAYAKVPIS